MQRLLDIMAKLRSPEGCPWDREQTHQSIRPGLIEECYELVEALDASDDKLMQEELGDVLIQVVFHAQLAKERGIFTFEDVVKGIADKLVRRHPHVFGDGSAKTSEEVMVKWAEIKKTEKPERTSALSGIPKILPALALAQEVQKKAARVGFDWKDADPVWEKVGEELAELEHAVQKNEGVEEELGDLLFAIVNLSRHLKQDAEQACRLATKKFSRRFKWVEEKVKQEGKEMKDLSLAELDVYWKQAKGTKSLSTENP